MSLKVKYETEMQTNISEYLGLDYNQMMTDVSIKKLQIESKVKKIQYLISKKIL